MSVWCVGNEWCRVCGMYWYVVICYWIFLCCVVFGVFICSGGRYGYNWKYNIIVLKKFGFYSGFYSVVLFVLYLCIIILQEFNMKIKIICFVFVFFMILFVFVVIVVLVFVV